MAPATRSTSTSISASEQLWILGIHMTKFGKHPDKDLTDLSSEAVLGALADGDVTMKDIGVIGAGNLLGGGGGAGQALQKQLGLLNYYEGPVDGLMGPQTTAAITYLQRDAGLPQTGTMNAATQAALQNYLVHGNNQMAG